MEIDYPPALYADTRRDAIEFFRSLTPKEAETLVPLNPGWRIIDVAAHVCGIADDVLQGNVGGLGTDEWTQAQVDKRSGMTLAQVCDEWQGYGAQIDERTAADSFFGVRITGDLILHMQDVRHALGLDIDQGDLASRLAAHRYVPPLQKRALDRQGLGVVVELSDGETYPAPADATSTITLRCSSYDFLRSVTGRRSRRQVEALHWDGDPALLLDTAWNTYGDLSSVDVSV